MNIGSLTSLSGFMMTDVLALRSLAIFGSICGITFNLTRIPQQLNGALWGAVLISVNSFMIIKLIRERQKIKFSASELELYEKHFRLFDVAPASYFKLIKLAQWHSIDKGTLLVQKGVKFESVLLINEGKANFLSPTDDETVKYTYEAVDPDSTHYGNCIIGGSILVDNKVIDRPVYPANIVVSSENLEYIEWNYHELIELLQEDSSLRVAFLHTLHESLIKGIRKVKNQTTGGFSMANLSSKEDECQYTLIVKAILKSGYLDSYDRRILGEYQRRLHITEEKHFSILNNQGWTIKDWERGRKQNESIISSNSPASTTASSSSSSSGAIILSTTEEDK